MLENVALIILGAFFMVGAFLAKGMRPALSRRPSGPITTAQRVIIFAFGLLMLVMGVRSLLKA